MRSSNGESVGGEIACRDRHTERGPQNDHEEKHKEPQEKPDLKPGTEKGKFFGRWERRQSGTPRERGRCVSRASRKGKARQRNKPEGASYEIRCGGEKEGQFVSKRKSRRDKKSRVDEEGRTPAEPRGILRASANSSDVERERQGPQEKRKSTENKWNDLSKTGLCGGGNPRAGDVASADIKGAENLKTLGGTCRLKKKNIAWRKKKGRRARKRFLPMMGT